jgi:prophage regulatory protein
MKPYEISNGVDHPRDSRRELMSRSDLRALGIRASNPTLLIWEEEGRFPKRLTLSPAKVAWLRHEVIAWIDAKAAARN